MLQAPGLETVQNRSKLGFKRPDFLRVIFEPVGLVVRNGILILADISQHAQKPVLHLAAQPVEEPLPVGCQ